MTVTITGKVTDVTARKDSRPWKVWSPVYRQGVNGEIITVTGQSVKVVGGVVTIELEPGAAVIENPDGQRYAVTVPDEDANLWDIISAAVAFPPDTAAEALADAVTTYLEDNPPVADWDALDNKPAVVGAGATQAAARAAIGASDTASVAAAQATAEAAQVRRLQLTDNCIGRSQSGYAVTGVGTYRFAHKVGVAGTDIQLGFGSWYTANTPIVDADPAATVTFSVGFEDAAGRVYAVTFNGARTVTLPGGGFVLSDPLPIDVAVGDVVFVRVYQSAGTSYANRSATGVWAGASGGGFTATTDLTASGAGAVSNAFKQGLDAMCIIGTPASSGQPRSVVLQGDSITAGAGDGIYGNFDFGYIAGALPYGGGSFWMRALSGNAGVINVGTSSDLMNYFAANAGHFRRGALTRFVKFAVLAYGENDINGLRTQAQLEADILTQAKSNVARGILGNVVPTITPHTTSSDRFATTANQTIVSSPGEAVRVAHNAWVRAGCPIVNGAAVAVGTSGALLAGQPGHPILGYVEVTDVVESARDSGKYKAALRTVADAAITSGANTLTSATGNFTSADVGRDVIIAGAGSAGANLIVQIVTINSTTSVAVTDNAATTVSGATCVVGPYTNDGLHPNTMSNKLIATAIQAPLLALLS